MSNISGDCANEDNFDLGERLVSTCVYEADYTPFRWNYILSFLTVLLWFPIARYLYDGYYRLLGEYKDFTLAHHLTKRDNPALCIQFAAYLFSVGFVMRGSLNSLPIEDDKLGEYFYTFFAYQALGLAFMICVMLLNDYVVLRAISNFKSIIEGRNVGTACVEAGALISSALVVAAAADGQYQKASSTVTSVVYTTSFGDGILATFLFWAIGQAMLICYVLLINWLYSLGIDMVNSPGEVELSNTALTTSEDEPPPPESAPESTGRRPSQSTLPAMGKRSTMISQIEAKGNVAAGLALGFDLICAGLAIATPIRNGFSLIAMVIWVPSVLLVMLPLMHLYLDALILRGAYFRTNVLHNQNWGAAVLVGTLKLLCVLLLDNLYQTNCATQSLIDTGVCEEPKTPNDLGDRLAINALPDVFKWQSLIDLFVLLLLLLTAKGLFHLRFVLRNGLSQASSNWATFSLDEILVDSKQNAIAVSLAGYMMGQGLVLVGVTTCFDDNLGDHTGLLFAWTAIGCVLMIFSQILNDKLIIMQLDNAAALVEDDNIAVALMEAGQYIATGLVIQATVSGGGGDFSEGLVTTIIFWALSQVLLLLFTVVYRKITVFDDLEQLKAANPAAGLGGAMTLVALAFGMAQPIRQYGSIAVFVPVSLAGFGLLVVLRLAIDKLILPGDKLDQEIVRDKNWGATVIEGAVACAVGLITNTYIKQAPDFDLCE